MSKVVVFFSSAVVLLIVIFDFAICKIAGESAIREEKMQKKVTEYCGNNCWDCSEWDNCNFSDRKLGGK